jgi:hypothetical protein
MLFNSIGRIVELKKYSEKVGSIKIKEVKVFQGKTYDTHFFLTVFADKFALVDSISKDSEVEISGYIKNGSYEKDGQKVLKEDKIVTEIKVLKAAAVPDIPF